MTEEAQNLQGPHPDPPAGEPEPGISPQGPHPDPPLDEVDEASMESFPNSDPPANWAGADNQ